MATRRLIAVLVAVGLVAGAILIRNAIDNGGGGGGGDSGGKPRLVCTPELEQVCRSLGTDVELTIEEPGLTAEKLEKASDDLGIDGWLTPGPWPQIVAEARQRAGKARLISVGRPLARSPVGLAMWSDRLGALNSFCKPQLSWKCIGDAADKGRWDALGGQAVWGAIKIGVPDPANNATGLAALGAATVGYFGNADLSSTDLDDAGFRRWLRGLAGARPNNPGLADVLARGPAEAAGAATFEAVGKRLVSASARKPTLTYPAPVASAEVVLGSAETDAGRRLAGLVTTDDLLKDKWQAPTGQPSGLPAAGLLDALRSAWREAAG